MTQRTEVQRDSPAWAKARDRHQDQMNNHEGWELQLATNGDRELAVDTP
jgi:hypothetical protein